MSSVQRESKVSVTELPPSHSISLQNTLKRILLTPLATHTFAQIIDDLPTRDDELYFPIYSMEIRNNSQPTLEAMAAAATFLKDSIESDIRIDPAVCSFSLSPSYFPQTNSWASYFSTTNVLLSPQ